MDIAQFLELSPVPHAVFDRLSERADQVRFYAPEPITCGDFAERIRRVACGLRATGLRAGDRAAVFAHNSVNWAAAALGIQAAGGVLVPIYPSSTAAQAGYILDHSDAVLVFVDDRERAERALATGDRRLVFLDRQSWQELMEQGRDTSSFDTQLDQVQLDQPALMLYTSGTTGNPKGVPLTHANLAANGADWLRNNAPLLEPLARDEASDPAIDLMWLPMSHIFGFGELCAGNLLGFTTHLVQPADVLGRMPDVAPTVFMSVPAYWEKLAVAAAAAADPVAELRRATGGRLRLCISGGAGLKREIKEQFLRAGVLILEGYGLTETSPTLTLNSPGDYRFDSVGKPVASVELCLAEDGEILARGPNVFSGYHKDPEATRAAFTDDGWFKTGDIGRLTEDGFLQIVDRKKDILVTSGGKNIPPANVERGFRDDPCVDQVIVYGDGKKYLVAGVWPNRAALAERLTAEPTGTGERDLIARSVERVNAALPRHETIKRFAIFDGALSIDNGLLTESLKVRRKKVYEAYRAEFEALYDDAHYARIERGA